MEHKSSGALMTLGIRANRGKCVIHREEDVTVRQYLGLVPDHLKADYIMGMTTCVGIIVAMGPPALTDSGTEIKSEFRVGDRVVFGRFAGQDVNLPKDLLDGREVFNIYEKDIHFGIPPRI